MDAEHEPGMIQIEVAYANPDKQIIRAVSVASGTTVAEAIELTAIKDEFPGIEIDPGGVGIFSRKVPMGHVLREGDRVEIYRPLIADPKEVRRERAKNAKA
jgi:putative ubiquitin-RnfH superfamily antitoxin RatB of RatAB toxin-antitoxin module